MSAATKRQPEAPATATRAADARFTIVHACGHLGGGLLFTVEAQEAAKAAGLKVKCPSCRQRDRFRRLPEMTPEVTPSVPATSEELAAEARRLYGDPAQWKRMTKHSCGCEAEACAVQPTAASLDAEAARIEAVPCAKCRPLPRGTATLFGGSGKVLRVAFRPRCKGCDASVEMRDADRGTDGEWTCHRCAARIDPFAGVTEADLERARETQAAPVYFDESDPEGAQL